MPKDIFERFGEDSYVDSPAFLGQIDSHVKADQLDNLIKALELRGCTIFRD